MQVKFAKGEKAKFNEQLTLGNLESGTVAFVGDEIYLIDDNGTAVPMTTRTSAEIEVMGVTIGALKDGFKIPSNKSPEEIIKMMVQQEINPTYSQPSVSLSNNGGTVAGTYESGTTITPKLKSVYTKNDAGALSNHVLYKGSVAVSGASTENPLTVNDTTFVLGDETVTYKSTATYDEGDIKNTNFGNPYPTGHITAGSKNSSNYNYVGARKLFYGTKTDDSEISSDVVRGLSKSTMSPKSGTTFTVNVPVGAQTIIIAYPATIGKELSKALYVEQSNTDISGTFRANKQVIKVADSRGGTNGLVDYWVYKYTMLVPAAATMTINCTI